MSENDDLLWLEDETPAGDTPAAEPTEDKPAEPPAASLEELEKVKAQLAVTEKKFQDAVKVLSGGDPSQQNPDQYYGNMTPGQFAGVVGQDAEVKAAMAARNEAENQILLKEYQDKNPDLVPYQDLVTFQANKYYADGKPKREALDLAVADIRKLQGQPVRKALPHQALDLSSPANPAKSLSAEEIWLLPSEDFERLDRQHGKRINSY